MQGVASRIIDLLPHGLAVRLKAALTPLARRLDVASAFVRDLWAPFYVAEHAGRRLAIFGDPTELSYFMHLFFSQETRPVRQGRVPFWRLSRAFEAQAKCSDLVLINLMESLVNSDLKGQTFRLPPLVSQSRELPPPGQDLMEALRNKRTREDLRLVRKHQYDYDITCDLSLFRTFYEEHYRPTIVQRHGTVAYVKPFDAMRQILQQAPLMMIRRDGQFVAGGLVQRRGDTLALLYLGVKDADAQLMREGAISALYYLTMREALKQGCTRVDLGRSEPFLNDGVVIFKRKWCDRIGPDRSFIRPLHMGIGRAEGCGMDFLEHNPVFAMLDADLVGVLFFGGVTDFGQADLLAELRRHGHGGQGGLVVCLLNEAWSARREAVQALAPDVPCRLLVIDGMAAAVGEDRAVNWPALAQSRWRATAEAAPSTPSYPCQPSQGS